jgi:hypothetical protein
LGISFSLFKGFYLGLPALFRTLLIGDHATGQDDAITRTVEDTRVVEFDKHGLDLLCSDSYGTG